MTRGDSRAYWDEAARDDAAWYVATGSAAEDQRFFALGAEETDHYLAFCGLRLSSSARVVEIGCGVGRMTRRLSELAGTVVATDVSGEMLARCRRRLADRDNVEYLLVPGDGRLPGVADGSVDAVFSYITLQHVPASEAQLRYLTESLRVLRPGGRAAIQVRAGGLGARLADWAGHLGHLAAGRRTLRPEWRGSRLQAEQIMAAIRAGGGRAELRPNGRRHLWVVAEAPAVRSGPVPTPAYDAQASSHGPRAGR